MKMPVLRMYEHNEAYLCWDRMISEGYISPAGNFLLHIDHHDDMEGAGYNWDFTHRPQGDEVYDFTYNVLGIADFIQPAVFYRIFSDVHILKNLMPMPVKTTREIIRLKDNNQLLRTTMIPFIHAGLAEKDPDSCVIYNKHEGGLDDVQQYREIINGKQIVLDIDLDYFCWDDSLSTRNPKRIEITKEAYKEYMEDKYHFIRILPKRLMDVVGADGRYYLEYREKMTSNKRPDEERIIKRMDKLIKWLADCEITPAAIDICSSHISGYLPKEMYPWIEETFLEKLGRMWELELV